MNNLSESFHSYKCFQGVVRVCQEQWYYPNNRGWENSIKWRLNYCVIDKDNRFKGTQEKVSDFAIDTILSLMIR